MTLEQLINAGIITGIKTEGTQTCGVIKVDFVSPNQCTLRCTLWDQPIETALNIINCIYDNMYDPNQLDDLNMALSEDSDE